MKPSHRQLDIFDNWIKNNFNIIINAVAGSGKSTTLLNLLELCDFKVLFLAFNKSIQTELEEKMADPKYNNRGKAMTLHSMGLMSIRTRFREVKINTGKGFGIFYDLIKNHKKLFYGVYEEERSKIMFSLLDLSELSRIFYNPDYNEILNLKTSDSRLRELLTLQLKELRKYALNMDKIIYDDNENFIWMWYHFLKLREKSYNSDFIEIDYTDMIYLPVRLSLHIPIDPYYLFVDEVQDLSLLQCLLVKKLILQGSVKKCCFVGDKNQSIYGFTGAYGDSFNFFKELKEAVELPLDINYRCELDIIDKANEIYNNLTAFKSEKGIVAQVGEIPLNEKDIDYYFYTNQKDRTIDKIKSNSMIICRNNRPLLELFFDLVAAGKKTPSLIGNDILNSVLNFVKPYKKTTLGRALFLMGANLDKLRQDKLKSDENAIKYYLYEENFKIFKLLFSKLGNSHMEMEAFIDKINYIFSQESDIKLCTIHKSKGMEHDRVYILNEFLIPSKFAQSTQQIQQEMNLKYVARTRAKKELYFLNILFERPQKNEFNN